jgi:hypothetical protein
MSKEKKCAECGKVFFGRKSSQHCSHECKFWSMFDKSGGPDACWPWKSNKNPGGYGNVPAVIAGTGKRTGAHRLAFKLHHGADPGPLSVCHECDRRECGNPAHLWSGTQRDNLLDAIRKGKYVAVAPGELHPAAKLTEEKVRFILTTGEKAAALAEQFGVAVTTIRAVRKGKTWRHIAADEEALEFRQQLSCSYLRAIC